MNLWGKLTPPPCYPNNCQCELIRNEIIRQPSSFWSSIVYVLYVFALTKVLKNKTTELRIWSILCLSLGLARLFGHASFSRLGLTLDLAALLSICSFFPIIRMRSRLIIFPMLFILYVFILYFGNVELKNILMGLVIFFGGGSLALDIKRGLPLTVDFYCFLILSFISLPLFLLDENQIFCDPKSWFQLHSLWHIGTGFSLYFFGKWQFEIRLPYIGQAN